MEERYQKIVEKILRRSPKIITILEILEKYSKENKDFKNYYLAAGCINQTILNDFHGFSLDYGIEDYDIVYYDDDVSYEKEDKIIKELEKRLIKVNASFDIKNQKRVPIWYKEKFNEEREEYTSVEDAISRWNSTITCIGVRLDRGKITFCTPYGLEDLINMVIRPVKIDTTEELYEKKANKWKSKWNRLTIIPWNKKR